MLVVVSFPMLDTRGLSTRSARLNVPRWAPPGEWDWSSSSPVQPGFVRNFGSIERRRRGGAHNWPREDVFANARRALELDFSAGSRDTRRKLVFRRLFSDGHAIARIDVGIRLEARTAGSRRTSDTDALGLIDAMNTPAAVTNQASGPQPLWRSGPQLAHAYTAATEAAARRDHRGGSQDTVLACQPIGVVESAGRPGRDSVWLGPDRDVSLEAARIRLQPGTELPAWIIRTGDDRSNWRDRRLLRIALTRQHAERVTLLRLVRLMESDRSEGDAALDSSLVNLFIKRRLQLIGRNLLYGFPQSEIVNVAWTNLDQESNESLATTVDRLGRLDPGYDDLVNDSLRKLAATEPRSFNLTVIEEATLVSEETKVISLGPNSTVSAPIVIADTIKNSFNQVQSVQDDELRRALEDLHESVATWSRGLGENQAEDVATDLEALTAEAKRQEPRPSRIKTLVESIHGIAESVADNAAPVLAALGAIAQIFGFG